MVSHVLTMSRFASPIYGLSMVVSDGTPFFLHLVALFYLETRHISFPCRDSLPHLTPLLHCRGRASRMSMSEHGLATAQVIGLKGYAVLAP